MDTGAGAVSSAADRQSATRMLKPGTILQDRYVIVDMLAEGGMGEVYRAEYTNLRGRYVAVKASKIDQSNELLRRQVFKVRRGVGVLDVEIARDQPLVATGSVNIGLSLMSVKRLRIKDATTLVLTTLTDDDYRIWGQYLEFTVPQSGFLELICTVKPAALIDDAQALDVPTGFDMGAVFYAVAMCGLGDESGFGASFMQQFLMKKQAWETDPGLETTYVYGLNERDG